MVVDHDLRVSVLRQNATDNLQSQSGAGVSRRDGNYSTVAAGRPGGIRGYQHDISRTDDRSVAIFTAANNGLTGWGGKELNGIRPRTSLTDSTRRRHRSNMTWDHTRDIFQNSTCQIGAACSHAASENSACRRLP